MSSDEADRAYWDRHAANYDRSMRVLGKPIPRMVELAAEAVRGASRVLEVAAGTGLVTTALAKAAHEVVATDYAAAMVAKLTHLARAENLSNVHCEQADLYALQFAPASFDAVVAANVLHLVPDLARAIDSLRRVLKPGGRLVVPTYCHDETAASWVLSRLLALTGFPGHRRFTHKTLVDSLTQRGLRITRSELLPGVIPIAYVDGTFDPE